VTCVCELGINTYFSVDATSSAPMPLNGRNGNTKRDFVASFVDLCLDKQFRTNNPEKFNEYVQHTMQYRRSVKGSNQF
jgi:hypothetical protein